LTNYNFEIVIPINLLYIQLVSIQLNLLHAYENGHVVVIVYKIHNV